MVDSGSVTLYKRVIFWETGVDSGSVAYIVVKMGGRPILWERGVYSGRVAYICLKGGYILGGRGRF